MENGVTPIHSLARELGLVPRSAARRAASQAVRRAALWAGITPALNHLRRRSAVVLMYHKVQRRPWGTWGEPVLDGRAFEDHCRFLSREAHVVPLRELVAHVRNGAPLPPRAAAITFDDGYRNNLVVAEPLLRKYRLPATVFVTTGLCGTERWNWCYEVEELARRHPLASLCRGIGDPVVERIATALLDPRHQALLLVEYLKRAAPEAREPLLSHLRRHAATPPDEENRFLSWNEVRALAAAGVEIGNHTVSHEILTRLASDQAELEIARANDDLRRETGRPAAFFCYPNGDSSPMVRELVRRHHRAAVSVEPGWNGAGVDPYLLRRVGAPVRVADLAYLMVRPRG